MLHIEQRVAAECDVPELPAAFRDDCTCVSCGAPAIAVHRVRRSPETAMPPASSTAAAAGA